MPEQPKQARKKRAPDYQKERGERQEARILGLLAESPMGLIEIASALFCSTSNASIYLRRLSARNAVHIVGFHKTLSRPAPIWAAGSGDSAEYVPLRFPCKIPSVEDRKKQVLELLATPRTVTELTALMNLTRKPIQVYMRALRNEKKVYIKEWRHPGKRGDRAPVYACGNKPDAPKSGQTRAERYRAEMSDPDRRDRIAAKRRARWRVDVARKKQQHIFSALGI